MSTRPTYLASPPKKTAQRRFCPNREIYKLQVRTHYQRIFSPPRHHAVTTCSPLLWEDKAAHRGPVVALERVQEACPAPAPAATAAPADLPDESPPPPPPRRAREWIVSAGRGGEVRVWKVPARWPACGTSGEMHRPVGLEFCATLLTGVSIYSFCCVLLCPPDVDRGAAAEGNIEERGKNGSGGRRRRQQRRGGGAEAGCHDRLYCVVGSDHGFVQAWEISLEGEEGVGDHPLWSQKVSAINHRPRCLGEQAVLGRIVDIGTRYELLKKRGALSKGVDVVLTYSRYMYTPSILHILLFVTINSQ